MALDYFYDGQFKAYIIQVIRAFSGFQYSMGKNADGSEKLRTIPATYASQDKQVASIINNNSENTILSTPQISVYITNVEMNNSRRQIPNHVDTQFVHEREINKLTNKYTQERGKSYTVERFMPVPYDITFQVDIWTSNESQKQQILEQILVLYNPSIDIQTSTNPIDWSSLTSLELQSVNWTSRTIPIGTSDSISISTLVFKTAGWLNPPAKVKQYKLVEQIIANINDWNQEQIDENKNFDTASIDWMRGDLMSRTITTPGNHCTLVRNNTIKLLGEDTLPLDSLGQPWVWSNLFELYGKYRPGQSMIELKTNEDMADHESSIYGTITIDEDDPSLLHYNIDISTLPPNNLPPINGIIDPHKTWPSPHNATPAPNPLPTPQIGDRYMILNDIAANTTWRTLDAKMYDIIQYDSDGFWFIAFNAQGAVGTYTCLNKKTGKQITWNGVNNQGGAPSWDITIDGLYTPGMWRILL